MEIEGSWNPLIRPGESNGYFELEGSLPFDPEADGFDPVNAWWLCELCRLIYRRGPDECRDDEAVLHRDHFLAPYELREIGCFSTDRGYCSLVVSEGEPPFAVLVFRGTTGFVGWFANLNTLQAPWSGGGAVHSGFKAEFLPLWEKIERVISTIEIPLFYTGHSLGGAFAILAASMLAPKAVYTFGVPRVGDAVFAKRLSEVPIYRVNGGKDIVATLPPSVIPFEFRHVGELFFFAEREDIARQFTDPPAYLSDHAPLSYTIRLARCIRDLYPG